MHYSKRSNLILVNSILNENYRNTPAMKYTCAAIKMLLLFLTLSLSSQAQTDSSTIKKQILLTLDSVNQAFFKNDWPSFANYMHPSVIKMIGTKEEFIAYMGDFIKTLPMVKMEKMEPGNILQLIKTGQQWQCLVEGRSQMHVDDMLVSSVSSSIGFSEDNGATWKFIRVNNGAEETIQKEFPDISEKLHIPYNKMVYNVTLEELLQTYIPEYPVKAIEENTKVAEEKKEEKPVVVKNKKKTSISKKKH